MCVLSIEPDIVCLQEVTPRSAGPGRRCSPMPASDALMPELPRSRASSRPLAVLTAARELDACPQVEDVPWPERVLAARVGGVEVVNVHSPVSEKPGAREGADARGGLPPPRDRRGPSARVRRSQHAAPRARRRQRLDVRAHATAEFCGATAASATTPPSTRWFADSSRAASGTRFAPSTDSSPGSRPGSGLAAAATGSTTSSFRRARGVRAARTGTTGAASSASRTTRRSWRSWRRPDGRAR